MALTLIMLEALDDAYALSLEQVKALYPDAIDSLVSEIKSLRKRYTMSDVEAWLKDQVFWLEDDELRYFSGYLGSLKILDIVTWHYAWSPEQGTWLYYKR